VPGTLSQVPGISSLFFFFYYSSVKLHRRSRVSLENGPTPCRKRMKFVWNRVLPPDVPAIFSDTKTVSTSLLGRTKLAAEAWEHFFPPKLFDQFQVIHLEHRRYVCISPISCFLRLWNTSTRNFELNLWSSDSAQFCPPGTSIQSPSNVAISLKFNFIDINVEIDVKIPPRRRLFIWKWPTSVAVCE